MRFAFAGFDLWCGVFDAFIGQGWEPLALFTMPVDNQHDFNQGVVTRAQSHGIPVQMSPIRAADLHALRERHCDVLVVAGHCWRIPDWSQAVPISIRRRYPKDAAPIRCFAPSWRAAATGR